MEKIIVDTTWLHLLNENVVVPEPNDTDIHSHSFIGYVVGFKDDLAIVLDSEDQAFEIEAERLTIAED